MQACSRMKSALIRHFWMPDNERSSFIGGQVCATWIVRMFQLCVAAVYVVFPNHRISPISRIPYLGKEKTVWESGLFSFLGVLSQTCHRERQKRLFLVYSANGGHPFRDLPGANTSNDPIEVFAYLPCVSRIGCPPEYALSIQFFINHNLQTSNDGHVFNRTAGRRTLLRQCGRAPHFPRRTQRFCRRRYGRCAARCGPYRSPDGRGLC